MTIDQIYFKLFAAVSNAVEELEDGNMGRAKQILIQAQQEAEDAYVSMEENT